MVDLLDAAKNFVGPSLGDDTGVINPTSGKSFFVSNSDELKSISGISADSFFFNFPKLDGLNAFKQFPYQFIVHDGQGKVILTLTMPLAPQMINISVPIAGMTTVTQNSISEESNGAPLRPIVISGTTGIRPSSGFATQGDPNSVSNLLQYAFSNTISAAKKVATDAQNLAKAVQGDSSITSPVAANDLNETLNDTTSYNIVHNMMRFLDWYIDAKKAGNRKLFLCFCMHKDQMYYDVSLNNYNIRKAAGTLEYEYTVNMTAWRRRKDSPGKLVIASSKLNSALQQSNVLQQISQVLALATTTVSDAGNILNAISADYEKTVLGPIKQVGLLVATLGNTALKISNFGTSISNQTKDAQAQFLKSSESGYLAWKQALKKKGINVTPSTLDAMLTSKTPSNPTGTPQKFASSQPAIETADNINAIFKNPNAYADVFGTFDVSQLQLDAKSQALINSEINAAQALTSTAIAGYRTTVETFAARASEYFGGGDATYNRLQGLPAPKSNPTRVLNTTDINLLSAFNDIVLSFDYLINAMNNASPTTANSYETFYQDYALTSGIDFQSNSSKFYVPFPLGASLESLAVKYLGDVDRWIEIAAVNALKAPYIDEDGYTLPLLSNASGSSVTLANPGKIYVGEIVLIESDTQPAQKRKVRAIDVLTTVETVVFLDGEPNLNNYKLVDNARIHAFMPDTVNSNMLLAIPSNVPVNIPGSIQTNPDQSDLSAIAYLAKTDFQLIFSDDGTADIGFGPFDVLTIGGMGNLTQAGLIKLLTNQGDILSDLTFGNPVKVGQNIAELNTPSVLSTLSALFADDPRFTGIIASKIDLKGGALSLSVLAGVTGSKAYLPLKAAVPR